MRQETTTITTNIYKYEELSKDSKKYAFNNWKKIQDVNSYDDLKSNREDAFYDYAQKFDVYAEDWNYSNLEKNSKYITIYYPNNSKGIFLHGNSLKEYLSNLVTEVLNTEDTDIKDLLKDIDLLKPFKDYINSKEPIETSYLELVTKSCNTWLDFMVAEEKKNDLLKTFEDNYANRYEYLENGTAVYINN